MSMQHLSYHAILKQKKSQNRLKIITLNQRNIKNLISAKFSAHDCLIDFIIRLPVLPSTHCKLVYTTTNFHKKQKKS